MSNTSFYGQEQVKAIASSKLSSEYAIKLKV